MKDKTINDNSAFIPIEAIFRDDADVTFVFLSGQGTVYAAPSTDEWYRISPIKLNISSTDATSFFTTDIYLPIELASPLGCVEQY